MKYFYKFFISSIIMFLLFLTACSTSPVESSLAGKINPINDFDIKNYEQYAATLQNENGYSEKEASKYAFEVELLKVALINHAMELGIAITDEDAKKQANEGREMFETGKLSNEEKKGIEETIVDLGITEEQFWNEYVVQTGAKMQLMIERLQDYQKKHYPEMKWDDFANEIVENFIIKETEKINKFKELISLD
ncbi:hypothetical protein DS745_02475 [Anaerobacillus alkaliphilus]|uniref:Uncharacterized protein n=1 Tax=Anaerobacillus alkaliphilus TaxID=1548597 RepID=A0A4Q0VXK7_9BACI|nr:hypothetical protein [Anaerobacillus alkaliphilus]RXJ04269.1 hypothetical protein DS745_02475 [Anaerobacillus alkaliphilus]